MPAAALVVSGLVLFGSAGRDDAHLTYWPAHTFATTGAIVNYNGERVEQSSSLLHVVVLAIAHRLTGVDVVTLGRLSSVVFGIAAVVMTGLMVRRAAGPRPGLAAALRHRVVVLICVLVATTTVLVVLRLTYFGSAFPQPVTAKGADSLEGLGVHMLFGAFSVAEALLGALPRLPVILVTAVAVVATVVRQLRAEKPDVLMATASVFVVASCASVVLAGGDWMEGARMFVPMIPVAAAGLVVSSAPPTRPWRGRREGWAQLRAFAVTPSGANDVDVQSGGGGQRGEIVRV